MLKRNNDKDTTCETGSSTTRPGWLLVTGWFLVIAIGVREKYHSEMGIPIIQQVWGLGTDAWSPLLEQGMMFRYGNCSCAGRKHVFHRTWQSRMCGIVWLFVVAQHSRETLNSESEFNLIDVRNVGDKVVPFVEPCCIFLLPLVRVGKSESFYVEQAASTSHSARGQLDSCIWVSAPSLRTCFNSTSATVRWQAPGFRIPSLPFWKCETTFAPMSVAWTWASWRKRRSSWAVLDRKVGWLAGWWMGVLEPDICGVYTLTNEMGLVWIGIFHGLANREQGWQPKSWKIRSQDR